MLRFRQEKTNWERIRKLPDPMAKTKEALVWTDMSYFSSGARGVGWRQVLQIIQIQTLLIHRYHRALGWDHRRGKVAAVLPNTNCLSLFFSETGSHYAALSASNFTVYKRLFSNSPICLPLPPSQVLGLKAQTTIDLQRKKIPVVTAII